MNIYCNPTISKMFSIQLKPPKYFCNQIPAEETFQVFCPCGSFMFNFLPTEKACKLKFSVFFFYARLFWHNTFLVINCHFELWSNNVMMLIFGKNTFFQVLNILSHKNVINIEGDTILMMQNEFCMCIRFGRTLGPRFKFSSKFGRFYWDCLAGQKNPEKPRKKKKPLGIGLKTFRFVFLVKYVRLLKH